MHLGKRKRGGEHGDRRGEGRAVDRCTMHQDPRQRIVTVRARTRVVARFSAADDFWILGCRPSGGGDPRDPDAGTLRTKDPVRGIVEIQVIATGSGSVATETWAIWISVIRIFSAKHYRGHGSLVSRKPGTYFFPVGKISVDGCSSSLSWPWSWPWSWSWSLLSKLPFDSKTWTILSLMAVCAEEAVFRFLGRWGRYCLLLFIFIFVFVCVCFGFDLVLFWFCIYVCACVFFLCLCVCVYIYFLF